MMTSAPASAKAKASAKVAGQRAKQTGVAAGVGKPKLPDLAEYIASRDFTGALTLVEFNRRTADPDALIENLMWVGYCAFHLGRYNRALEAYSEVLVHGGGEEVNLFIACCHFYLQTYDKAEKYANLGPDCALKNRILFHTSHKQDDESKLMTHHQKLTDTKEDQLSLATIHYLRSHFQEATDIYKRLLLDNHDDFALNVYVAMCYYKLDYYDVSTEILAVYLQVYPDSAVALNLKACNFFRLYNGKAAEAELKGLTHRTDNDLIQHNLVVFSGGQGALKVLPSLVDFIPEARLNLVIYYLRSNAVQEAYDLIKELEPTTPQEYILKAVVNASIGQMVGSREHIKTAQQSFQIVGASASECDTIPGRQCMASCFMLLKQFEDVNIYLNSVKAYMYNDDDFNWNHGLSLASTGNYKAAEEALLLIQSERYKQEYTYISWLARCYIMNGSPRNAWELYLKMDTNSESFNLLGLVANDCYRMGHFLFAAKAFDVLERLDPDPEYWEGKRGASVGLFQQVIAGTASKDDLRDVLNMVRSNTNNPQVEYMMRIIKKWCKENGIKVG